MARGFFTGARLEEAGAEGGAEGPAPRKSSRSRLLAPVPEERSEAEAEDHDWLRALVDVLRSDLLRLEGVVAECRSDNSKTLAHLEKFVLDEVEQERRARAEELSEVRRWAEELVHSCMQTPSTSGAASPSSMPIGDETMKPPSSDGMGTRSSNKMNTKKASLLVDNVESTRCSASDVGDDVVHFGVAAMQVQLSELQDEFARSQDRFSSLASRVAALEQGEGGREATASLARLWEENDKLFHAVTAMGELCEENVKFREEHSKLGAAEGQSTPRHTVPRAVAGVATATATLRARQESDGPREEGAKLGAPAAQPTLRHTVPRAVASCPPVSCGPPAPQAGVATAQDTAEASTSPPPGQRRLEISPTVVRLVSAGGSSVPAQAAPGAGTSPPPGQQHPGPSVAWLVSAAGAPAPAQAAPPLPHGCFWQAEAAKTTAAAGRLLGGAVPPSAGHAAFPYSLNVLGLR